MRSCLVSEKSTKDKQFIVHLSLLAHIKWLQVMVPVQDESTLPGCVKKTTDRFVEFVFCWEDTCNNSTLETIKIALQTKNKKKFYISKITWNLANVSIIANTEFTLSVKSIHQCVKVYMPQNATVWKYEGLQRLSVALLHSCILSEMVESYLKTIYNSLRLGGPFSPFLGTDNQVLCTVLRPLYHLPILSIIFHCQIDWI